MTVPFVVSEKVFYLILQEQHLCVLNSTKVFWFLSFPGHVIYRKSCKVASSGDKKIFSSMQQNPGVSPMKFFMLKNLQILSIFLISVCYILSLGHSRMLLLLGYAVYLSLFVHLLEWHLPWWLEFVDLLWDSVGILHSSICSFCFSSVSLLLTVLFLFHWERKQVLHSLTVSFFFFFHFVSELAKFSQCITLTTHTSLFYSVTVLLWNVLFISVLPLVTDKKLTFESTKDLAL